MPKGKPRAGFRKSKRWREAQNRAGSQIVSIVGGKPHLVTPPTAETEEQIDARIKERFEIMKILVQQVFDGISKALIVSGPPGLGKSWTIESMLKEHDPEAKYHTFIKGYVRPTGLFKTLYDYRFDTCQIIFDDCDTIFFDETSLNLLKAVTDTTEKRIVSYLSETDMVSDISGESLPRQFEFDGSIIFITNYDFDKMIESENKLIQHLAALMSRANYIDMAMKNRHDYLVRVRQVVKEGMLEKQLNLSSEYIGHVMEFIEQHLNELREVSLRTALKVGAIRKQNAPNWERIAMVTNCKNK